MRYAAAPNTSTTTTMTVTVMATMLPALRARGTSSMVTPVVFSEAVASAWVGLITVTGGDVGSMARLDAMASVPREGTSLVSSGGWVAPGLTRTGVGDKPILGGEEGSLVGREEEGDGAAVPVGLEAAPKSIVLLARLAVFAVQRAGAVSKVGGTGLGLEAVEGPSVVAVELSVTVTGAGDSAATGVVALWPSPSTGLEDVPSPEGPGDKGSEGWPGAGVGTSASLESGFTGTPPQRKGGLMGLRGGSGESSPSPAGRRRRARKRRRQ